MPLLALWEKRHICQGNQGKMPEYGRLVFLIPKKPDFDYYAQEITKIMRKKFKNISGKFRKHKHEIGKT